MEGVEVLLVASSKRSASSLPEAYVTLFCLIAIPFGRAVLDDLRKIEENEIYEIEFMNIDQERFRFFFD